MSGNEAGRGKNLRFCSFYVVRGILGMALRMHTAAVHHGGGILIFASTYHREGKPGTCVFSLRNCLFCVRLQESSSSTAVKLQYSSIGTAAVSVCTKKLRNFGITECRTHLALTWKHNPCGRKRDNHHTIALRVQQQLLVAVFLFCTGIMT